MYLFILESIGTSELIMIGIIALIFLGPRKLPQIARTIGKVIADFRNTTNEFKSTWEREVNFEEEERALRTGELPGESAGTVPRVNSILNPEPTDEIADPEIREIDSNAFDKLKDKDPEQTTNGEPDADDLTDKRNWL